MSAVPLCGCICDVYNDITRQLCGKKITAPTSTNNLKRHYLHNHDHKDFQQHEHKMQKNCIQMNTDKKEAPTATDSKLT